MSETLSMTDITTGVENAKEQSILETLALTDTISKAAGIPMLETLSLTDTITKTIGIPLSETLSLSDVGGAGPINLVAKDVEDLTNSENVEVFTIGTKTYAIVTQPEYWTDRTDEHDDITIYDISNPSAIVKTDSERQDANGFDVLDGASEVDVFTVASNSTATYAIVQAYWEECVQIIDISNPSAIVAKDQ